MEGKIVHKTKSYALIIIPEKQQLQIILKLTKKQKRIFKTILMNQNLPKELQKNLRNIEIIYELFQDKQAVKVFEEEGKIVLKTSIIIKNKLIQTLSEIVLEEQEESPQNEKITQEIKFLKSQIEKLKKSILKNQENQQNLNQKEISKNIMQTLKQQVEEKFFVMRKEFLREYEVSDAQQKKQQNEKNEIQKQVYILSKQVQQQAVKTEKIQEKLKRIQTIFSDDLYKIKGKIQTLQNKIGEVYDQRKQMPQILQKSMQIKQESNKQYPLYNPFTKVSKNQEKINQTFSNFYEVVKNKYESEVKNEEAKPFYLLSQNNKFLQINQRKITYVGENKTWTSVLGSKTLSRGSVYEFEFRIIQSTYFSFKVGVCDKKRAQRQRQPSSDQSIFICGDNGFIFIPKYEPFSSTRGFREKDTITMKINLKKSSISFQIKGQKEVTINEEVSTFFSSGNKEFVPFVCLYRKGDSIEWIK